MNPDGKIRAQRRTQGLVILVGTGLLVLTILFPPWIQTFDQNGPRGAHTQRPGGYSFIASPPRPLGEGLTFGVKLDISRLLIEWVAVIALTGLVCFGVGPARTP